MLYLRKRAERLARETEVAFERQIAAVRIGVRSAIDPKFAAAYRRQVVARSSAPTQTVDGYKATLARLGALTSRGKPLGLVN